MGPAGTHQSSKRSQQNFSNHTDTNKTFVITQVITLTEMDITDHDITQFK